MRASKLKPHERHHFYLVHLAVLLLLPPRAPELFLSLLPLVVSGGGLWIFLFSVLHYAVHTVSLTQP